LLEDDGIISLILRESKDRSPEGPNLEFLGDVLCLANGFYAPSPTRAIKLNDTDWYLISGRPTTDFVHMGFDIQVCGIGRVIRDARIQDLDDWGIPVEKLEEYLGLPYGIEEPNGIIDLLVRLEEIKNIIRKNDWEAYTGSRKTMCVQGYKGFVWVRDPSKPLTISCNGRTLAFWRSPIMCESHVVGFDYWLMIENENANNSDPENKQTIGVIKIPRKMWKWVCISFDNIAGNPRASYIEQFTDGYLLSFNFYPPASIWRLLFLSHAEWYGHKDYRPTWKINEDAYPEMVRILNRVGLKVNGTSQQQKEIGERLETESVPRDRPRPTEDRNGYRKQKQYPRRAEIFIPDVELPQDLKGITCPRCHKGNMETRDKKRFKCHFCGRALSIGQLKKLIHDERRDIKFVRILSKRKPVVHRKKRKKRR